MRFRFIKITEEPELNLVPLIDVLLMTLIFLVVTTSFSKETQLRIKLPEASSQTQVKDFALRIIIDAGGHYYINGEQLINNSSLVLRSAMKKSIGDTEDPVIVIHADAKAAHESVVRVMDVARKLGYKNLTFATQEMESSGE